MENGILISYESRKGRLYLDMGAKNGKHIEYSELLTVLVGALSMTIRMVGEKGHKTEGEVFKSVISHLESEFINPDSFKDLEIKR